MFIIGEAGSNHNGSVEVAKALIDTALSSKVSSVKFQFINPFELYVPYKFDDPKQELYPVVQQRIDEQLTNNQWHEIWAYAQAKNIEISASIFDLEGIELLKDLGSTYAKIASTDLNNLSLIKNAAAAFDKLIISTGMSDFRNIIDAVSAAKSSNKNIDLTVLHCVSLYPCELKDAGISRLAKLIDLLDVPVGYSDHTKDSYAACAAAALGVRTFEKHFTIDKNMPGFDHAHAMDPSELKLYCEVLFSIKADLETSPFINKDDETANRAKRGVYFSKDLPAGHVITKDDLKFLRPSTRMQIKDASSLVGLPLLSPVKKYQPAAISTIASGSSEDNENAFDYWSVEMRDKGISNK